MHPISCRSFVFVKLYNSVIPTERYRDPNSSRKLFELLPFLNSLIFSSSKDIFSDSPSLIEFNNLSLHEKRITKDSDWIIIPQ